MNVAATSPIERLPDALLIRIVTFLGDRDVAMLSSCNRSLRNQFPIAQLDPPIVVPNIHLDGGHSDDDEFFYQLKMPATFYSTAATRSIQLSCRWKDQGWGNQKSQVIILATPYASSEPQPPRQIRWNELENDGRRSVAFTPNVAEHNWQPLALKFTPLPNEAYHLYLKAGGSGGHAIRLNDIRIQSVILDKPDRSISRNYKILSDLNVIGQQRSANSVFLLSLFQTSVAGLLLQLRRKGSSPSQEPQDQLLHATNQLCSVTQFLQSHGFNVTDVSALESIQDWLAAHQDDPVEAQFDYDLHPMEEFDDMMMNDFDDENEDGSLDNGA